jgi:hypothetical protein
MESSQFLHRGKQLDIINDFYYLGVELSRTGNFKNGKEGRAEKATRTLCEDFEIGKLYNLPIKCQLDLFDKMIT